MVAITPIVVLLALMVLGLVTEEKRSVIQSIVGAIESYVMTFLICFIIGILLGIVAKIGFNSMHTYGKYALLIAMRILCIIFVCVKYDWLQQKVKKTAVNVMILIGAFYMFFNNSFKPPILIKTTVLP